MGLGASRTKQDREKALELLKECGTTEVAKLMGMLYSAIMVRYVFE